MLQPMSIVYKNSAFPGIEALSCSDDFHFADHLHSGHVIWLNTACGEHYSVQGACDILQPGSFGIIEPCVVHSNHPCSGHSRHLRSLYLGHDFFSELEKRITGSVTGDYFLPTKVLRNRNLWHRLADLHQMIIAGEELPEVESATVVVFADLLRQFQPVRDHLSPVRDGGARLQGIVEYFHSNIDRQVSLDKLAKIAECTSYHIIRLFREHKGMSPHAYHMQLRLENARRLLDTGETIADAAYRSGFSDQSHLTRRFKQRYGLTPKVYTIQKLLS